MPFEIFPIPPAKLRTMIWNFVLPPQLITISTKQLSNLTGLELRDAGLRVYKSEYGNVDHDLIIQGQSKDLKALLFTCKESNKFVKEHYHLLFASRLSYAICFNTNIDTLYFADCNAVRSFPDSVQPGDSAEEDCKSVTKLATVMPFGEELDTHISGMYAHDSIKVVTLRRYFRNAILFLLVNRSPAPLDEFQMEMVFDFF